MKLDQHITCAHFLFPGNFEKGVRDLLFFFNVNLQNSSGAYNPEVSLTATNTEFSFFPQANQNDQQKDNLPG